jgi:hypothetical protein
MPRDLVQELAVRTPFSADDLVDFVVQNRSMSLPKMGKMLRLSVPEVRRLLGSADFRKRSSEVLTLQVVDLVSEERILDMVKADALSADTRPDFRVKSAEFLLRQAGVERAREAKVEVDHSIRVVFEPPRLPPADWRPPDPLAGVVGAPTIEARPVGALPSPVDEDDPDPLEEAGRWGESSP